MELRTIYNTKKPKKKEPHYKLVVEFMEGDANGYQKEKITFTEDEVEDYKPFIVAIAAMNNAYPCGRGGCDEYTGTLEYETYFSYENSFENYVEEFDFLTEDEKTILLDEDHEDNSKIQEKIWKTLNPAEINMPIPSDCNYLTCSFDGYELFFIDESGIKHDVRPIFNEKEQKRIDKFAKIYDWR